MQIPAISSPIGTENWKVANGIRLTGMPEFEGALTSDQMWQVSLLLANSDKLPTKIVSELQGSSTQSAGTPKQ